MSTLSVSLVVNSPASISVSFVQFELFAPVPVGSVLGNIYILPSGWSGALVLSGSDAGLFSLTTLSNGNAQVLNVVELSARNYNFVIDAVP